MNTKHRLTLALIPLSLAAAPGVQASQDPAAIDKTTLQVTARTLNFHGQNRKLWSWVPEFRFSLVRDRNSGDRHFVTYTIPNSPARQASCELNSQGNGFECGGRSIPESQGAIYTGPVSFTVKVHNELDGSEATLFTGRMKVAKACTNATCPASAGEWVYYIDHDWNLPIGHIYYDMQDPDAPVFNVAFWARGSTHQMEPHLFYQGKEIGIVSLSDGTPIGTPGCRTRVENNPTHTPYQVVGGARWSRQDCFFPMVLGWDAAGENRSDRFKMAQNPGDYEFKLLWNQKLARSIKFTVGPDGKLDNGIAAANHLGTGRVLVPVTVIGDQDGSWDKAAWKTEAFYGNPLTSFLVPQ